MNIARPVLNRLRQHEVHVADNRGCIRLVLQLLHIDLPILTKRNRPAQFLQNFIQRTRVRAVVLPDEVFDLIKRRDHRLHIRPQRKPQIFEPLQIQRIIKRELDDVVLHPQRESAVLLRQSAWQQRHDFRRSLKAREIRVFRADGVGDGLVKNFISTEAEIGNHLRQRLTSLGDLLHHVIELGTVHDACFYENIECLFGIHGCCVGFRSESFKRDFTQTFISHGKFIMRCVFRGCYSRAATSNPSGPRLCFSVRTVTTESAG